MKLHFTVKTAFFSIIALCLHEKKHKSINLTENSIAFHQTNGKQLESQKASLKFLTQKQTEVGVMRSCANLKKFLSFNNR